MRFFDNKRKKREEYRERLLKSFPVRLKNEVENVLSILPFDKKEIKLSDGNTHKIDNLIHSSGYEVKLNDEKLIIPYRLYFDEPTDQKENQLSEKEIEILNCIYLRHHNGYLRERRLMKLMNSTQEFVIPFTIHLIGEYVIELLEIIDRHVNESNLKFYKSFISNNPKYWQTTQSRMISYWDAYYRRKFPKIKEYIGYKIIEKIKK